MTIYRIARIAVALFISVPAFASKESYHLASPLGWMYDLPVGETPGWTSPIWFNFEASQASIWNVPTSLTDRRTGRPFSYQAMYEQTSAIAEIGVEVMPRVAFSVEIPYANHNSGFFSDFVKQFHYAIDSPQFERTDYPDYPDTFAITDNGDSLLSTDRPEGIGNLKFKLKFWLWQWMGDDKGSCDCGLAVSGQVKIPMQSAVVGLTSGSTDWSGAILFGLPMFDQSGIWFTAAFSELGANDTLQDWPLRRFNQIYEVDSDIGITDMWGILLEGRYTSPMMNEDDLQYDDPSATNGGQLALDRQSSAWNSLVYWTGSEAIGLRARWGAGHQVNFLFQENFAIGTYDRTVDSIYENNAPDFSFILQLHLLL